MKPNELRIGNYVYGFGTNPGIVDELHKSHLCIAWDNGTVTYSYDELKPISLTEDWLKKFGFRNTVLNGWTKKRFPIFELINNVLYPPDYLLSTFIVIKYVHQLQNLYFALTEKELILK